MKKLEIGLALAMLIAVVVVGATIYNMFDKSDTIRTKDDTIVVIWNDGKEVSAKGKIREYDDKVVVKVPGALLQKEDNTVEPVPAKTLVFYKHEIKAMIYLTK